MSEDQGNLFATEPQMKPWQMNASNSPTGRVMNDPARASVDAARSFDAKSHRAIAYRAVAHSADGLTSIEVARLLPVGRDGNPQNSNRSASRLGELWEEGRLTIQRERGACVLGVCHPHQKPRVVHRPTASCWMHGAIARRDGAGIWTVTGAEGNQPGD